MPIIHFPLRGEYIALDALLKACHLADSGGAAKWQIVEGCVRVDGAVELRRGRKVRAGQCVQVADTRIHLQAASPEPSADPSLDPDRLTPTA